MSTSYVSLLHKTKLTSVMLDIFKYYDYTTINRISKCIESKRFFPEKGYTMQIPDNFAYIVPVDVLIHTSENPFCWEMTCPCKGDQDAFAQLQHFIKEGVLTIDEAILLYCGRTV